MIGQRTNNWKEEACIVGCLVSGSADFVRLGASSPDTSDLVPCIVGCLVMGKPDPLNASTVGSADFVRLGAPSPTCLGIFNIHAAILAQALWASAVDRATLSEPCLRLIALLLLA